MALILHAVTALAACMQPAMAAQGHRVDLHTLFHDQVAATEAKRIQAEATSARLAALGTMRDRLWPLPPRLAPHDIPVITLDRKLTAAALQRLFSHECCAVHVRGFCEAKMCDEIASRLSAARDKAFTNWAIHQSTASTTTYSPTEVEKFGVTSGEAGSSWKDFQQYLCPSPANSLDELLPAAVNPFTQLREVLDALHPEGCRPSHVGGWTQPAGTFRRMQSSGGLIHADTATLLSHG